MSETVSAIKIRMRHEINHERVSFIGDDQKPGNALAQFEAALSEFIAADGAEAFKARRHAAILTELVSLVRARNAAQAKAVALQGDFRMTRESDLEYAAAVDAWDEASEAVWRYLERLVGETNEGAA